MWQKLSADPLFWRLVEDKVTSVTVQSNDTARLTGACYVGRAIVSDIVIDFVEKVPGAFAALASVAIPSTFKIFRVPSPVSAVGDTTGLLVKVFVEAAQQYAASAKEVRYAQRKSRGSLMGGALDLVETIRLRGRGVRHQVAFKRTELISDTPLNRAVFGALRRVEELKEIAQCDVADVLRARSLSLVLSDCAEGALAGSASLQAIAIDIADEVGRRADIVELAELSAAILGDSGFGGAIVSRRTVGRSWFVNLEKLFERAVRRTLRAMLAGVGTVEGATKGVYVFIDTAGRYPANTDIVIRAQEGPLIICDTKYKERPAMAWPDAADVQEILTHASAYNAKVALLVYPAEVGWLRRVGLAKTGCELWVIGLRLGHMEEDLRDVLNQIGLKVGVTAAIG